MKWTNRMRERLTEMYERGDQYDDMADAFDTTYASLQHQIAWLREQGIIGTRLDRGWTPSLDAELIERVKSGKSYAEVAKELGFSRNACIGRMRRLRAEKKAPPAKPDNRPPKPKRERVEEVFYKVHPMWSMPEDERRIAFYEKFRAGWAEVQERLNAGQGVNTQRWHLNLTVSLADVDARAAREGE